MSKRARIAFEALRLLGVAYCAWVMFAAENPDDHTPFLLLVAAFFFSTLPAREHAP